MTIKTLAMSLPEEMGMWATLMGSQNIKKPMNLEDQLNNEREKIINPLRRFGEPDGQSCRWISRGS